MTASAWRRVSQAQHCPICDHANWCLIARDGTAAICPRVESPKRIGEAGYLHRLSQEPWRPARQYIRVVSSGGDGRPRADLAFLAAEYQRAVDPGRLHQLAASLGVSVDSLMSLRIGWSMASRAWSFPMTDASGKVLGIRLRRAGGGKFAVRGGREGLFIPGGLLERAAPMSRLLICEGPSDAAALLDMGFSDVVGRPSCTGGIKLMVELVKRRQRPDVVIVADADEPGRRGADNLASVLVAYVPSVRVVLPAGELKDARDWLRAGGTRGELEQVIDAAPVRRGVIRPCVTVESGGRLA